MHLASSLYFLLKIILKLSTFLEEGIELSRFLLTTKKCEKAFVLKMVLALNFYSAFSCKLPMNKKLLC